MPDSRWEQGSEFHWQAPASGPARHPWQEASTLFATGRDALRAVVRLGRRARGWRRLWVPSYSCAAVVSALGEAGLPISRYPDGPEDRFAPPARAGDRARAAILLTNHFGLRAPADLGTLDRERVDVIEDHTHDPWSTWAWQSDADFCVVSLRKTLPLPDGGVVWSPRRAAIPPSPPASSARAAAVADKITAMVLKALYLGGGDVSKDAYRRLQARGEQGLASADLAQISPLSAVLLARVPVVEWRRRRALNHRRMVTRLSGLDGLRVLRPPGGVGSCPFSVVLVCDSAGRRERLRRALVARRIYPAILWPLEGAGAPIPRAHLEFSRRMLSLHCDMRYGARDMDRVARAVRHAVRA